MTETIIFLMAEKIWEALYGPPKYKEKTDMPQLRTGLRIS